MVESVVADARDPSATNRSIRAEYCPVARFRARRQNLQLALEGNARMGEIRHPAGVSSSRRSVVIPPKAGNHGRRIGIANQPCRRHRDVDQERVPRPVAPIMSGHRSRHSAFPDLTSSIFLCRDHPLIVFSRRMASTMVLWSSCQTRVLTPYRFVKLSARPSRCCQTRFTRFDVTPTYRVPRGLLASM